MNLALSFYFAVFLLRLHYSFAVFVLLSAAAVTSAALPPSA